MLLQLTLTHWHWFALAAILIILDVSLGANFFILWLGVCAAMVGGILQINPSLSWELQLLIFAVGSIACIAFWHFYLKKYPTKSDKPNLNRRSEQYIGRTFTLTTAISNGRGKIAVGDSIWTVSGADMPTNTQVKVTGANGIILAVISI
ncbi:MAG: hypothetical protein COC15_01390 [Legionellales bacterium]|nr:MAG: hypothetical protein COC15_01390 [Legionellales bacterium]